MKRRQICFNIQGTVTEPIIPADQSYEQQIPENFFNQSDIFIVDVDMSIVKTQIFTPTTSVYATSFDSQEKCYKVLSNSKCQNLYMQSSKLMEFDQDLSKLPKNLKSLHLLKEDNDDMDNFEDVIGSHDSIQSLFLSDFNFLPNEDEDDEEEVMKFVEDGEDHIENFLQFVKRFKKLKNIIIIESGKVEMKSYVQYLKKYNVSTIKAHQYYGKVNVNFQPDMVTIIT